MSLVIFVRHDLSEQSFPDFCAYLDFLCLCRCDDFLDI